MTKWAQGQGSDFLKTDLISVFDGGCAGLATDTARLSCITAVTVSNAYFLTPLPKSLNTQKVKIGSAKTCK